MAETKAKAAAKPAVDENDESRLVSVRLFKDGGKYRDDVFVSVGDYSYQIKRGEHVEVPFFIAEVLRQSEDQDANTGMMISELSSDFASKSKFID